MKHLRKRLLVVIAMVVVSVAAANAADINVTAQIDRRTDIYTGDSFVYQIVVKGTEEVAKVDTTPIEKYHPKNTGVYNNSSTSITIVNGRRTQTTISQYAINFSIRADVPGEIVLKPVSVEVAGDVYVTNPVTINILKPGQTDQIGIKAWLDEENCYVGQPVVMTVEFQYSATLGALRFSAPAFVSDEFYVENVDKDVKNLEKFDLGIGVEVYGSQKRINAGGKNVMVVRFAKVLIPKEKGNIEIEPVTVLADMAVGKRNRNSMFDDIFDRRQYKRVAAVSKPMTLNVVALPTENRPKSFYGLVGNYEIKAKAKPIEVNVGDPITLKIMVRGSDYLKPVKMPNLEAILGSDFKIAQEEPMEKIDENGVKIFTQIIRVDNNEVKQIPSIEMSFFDVTKRKYVTAKTEPISLDVTKTKLLTGSDVLSEKGQGQNSEIKIIQKGLSANYQNIDALKDMRFDPAKAIFHAGYMAMWLMAVIGLAIAVAVKIAMGDSGTKAAKKQKNAAKWAVAEIKAIEKQATNQHEKFAAILKEFIGRKFDRKVLSLTAGQCGDIVLNKTRDEQLTDDYVRLLQQCEAVCYAALIGRISNEEMNQAINLINQIEKKSKG